MNTAIKILLVEDDNNLREALCDILRMGGYTVLDCADAVAALAVLEQEAVQLILSDVRMAPMDGYTFLREAKLRHAQVPLLLMTAYGTIAQAVDALQHGAADYLVKPFDVQNLLDKVAQFAMPLVDARQMLAVDERSRQLAALATRVAASDASVMITGESGVGKEVLARFIHQHSTRVKQPFVAINCAAIPENLLEATLFGYEKGAFTGANQAMPGKFEQADGGTLLLDEVTEMPLALQAKLLRVVQEREVERLGGRKTVALNVRILATSNRDLQQAVAQGLLREDLYYRLNVFPLHIAALRERPADIVPLAQQFAQRWCAAHGRAAVSMSVAAQQALTQYPWLGNVRELENVLQRALILMAGQVLEAEIVQLSTQAFGQTALPDSPPPLMVVAEDALGDGLRSQERAMILAALEASEGSRKLAAQRLGISPRTLRHKIQQYRDAGQPLSSQY